MYNICTVCNSQGISQCHIEDKTIDICKECGAVFVHELNLIVQMQMPLQYDNNLYAVSFGIASLYRELVKTYGYQIG